MARECCVWGSSVRDMLPCAVRFLGQALDSVHGGDVSKPPASHFVNVLGQSPFGHPGAKMSKR